MAWHADHREWAALETVFAPTVRMDYTSLYGGSPQEMTAAELVAGWRDGLSRFRLTQHLTANYLVQERTATAATVVAAVQSTHEAPNDRGAPVWRIGGDFRFELTAEDGDWRIRAITFDLAWAEGNRALLG
ncbi:hypothetical protein GCM10018954_029140 [Kutzneria kofuensis]|jgi:hypothetical protein